MNAPAPPPKKPETKAVVSAPATGFGAFLGILVILPVIFLFLFHLGAGYLSYQKYGSGFYAFIDFLFAYFYYPYYAFFLSTPAPPTNVLMGGLRKLVAGKRRA